MTREKYAKLFKEEISDRANLVDPGNELDWYALIIGWAIGKGMQPKKAGDFALYIRYQTDLG